MGKSRGFTLIELLIVVAIIGLVAAIAVPSLLDAVERSRQSRSMEDIRGMVMALQTFGIDHGAYPARAYDGDPALQWPLILDTSGASLLIPDIIQQVPARDGWGRPYGNIFGPNLSTNVHLAQNPTTSHYVVYSLGSDGAQGGASDGSASAQDIAAAYCATEPRPPIPGVIETHCFAADIVWGDSQFQQSPGGKQRKC